MPVVHPSTYQRRTKVRKKRRWPAVLITLLVVALAANYLRPLPAATAAITVPGLAPATATTIAWPTYGQAAIGAAGYGVLATNGAQTALATASIAKVITALCVLQKEPLVVDQAGPNFTIGQNDVDIYNNYQTLDGSSLAVTSGEQISEYQALQAMLVPSANNIADSLARWVFGSQAAYTSFANGYLQQNGLDNTHIGTDASGFDASTTSTASDLTKLGLLALQSPVLIQIAGQKQITLPVAGLVQNYNTVLGTNGITGLKTGNNDADPGAFLFTASFRLGGKDIAVDGTVMGAPDLSKALSDATRLAASVQNGFEQVTVATAGKQLGSLKTPWGATAPIVTAQTLQLVHWKAAAVTETHVVHADVQGGVIGSITVKSGQATSATNLLLAKPLAMPSFWWRLSRH